MAITKVSGYLSENSLKLFKPVFDTLNNERQDVLGRKGGIFFEVFENGKFYGRMIPRESCDKLKIVLAEIEEAENAVPIDDIRK